MAVLGAPNDMGTQWRPGARFGPRGIREASTLNVPVLGQIPIDIATREGGDSGTPVALFPPTENKVSAAFHDIAANLRKKLG